MNILSTVQTETYIFELKIWKAHENEHILEADKVWVHEVSEVVIEECYANTREIYKSDNFLIHGLLN